MEKCSVAVCLLLIQEDEVLLMKRARTGFGDGFWAAPGGRINGNEPVSEAVIREVKEEIGITVEYEDLEFSSVIHTAPYKENPREVVLFIFTAKKYKGTISNCEPEKCDELQFFPIHHLPSTILPAGRQAIENLLSGNKLSTLFFDQSSSAEPVASL